MGHNLELTVHEALSGVFGSVSLAAWIFLLLPQLIENYRQGSAEGISLLFLCVWFVGDVCNLIGAVWAGLVPTVIALAVYFCFADSILISQCLYYNLVNARKRRKESQMSDSSEDSAEQPLLSRSNSTGRDRRSSRSSIGLPGSHRRSTHDSERRRDSLAAIMEEGQGSNAWVKNSLSVLAVCVAGAAGWAIAYKTGTWSPVPDHGNQEKGEVALGASILGYASAVAYLGARIPQIIKNQRDRSCEGLSLLFFLLSLLGNLTYGAGILFHSLERDYIITNLPWLVGSLGTMFEDVTIFIQFRIFGKANEAAIE